jgi:hypothetical protein
MSTPSWAAHDSDWIEVSGDRVGNVTRFRLIARFTNDRWDNTVGVCDRFDTQLDDGALGSFHGSRRVTQAERHELRLAVSSAAGSEPAIEGGSACALFEQRLVPLASGVDAAIVAHTFSFTTPRSLFDCLGDRFGRPLRCST